MKTIHYCIFALSIAFIPMNLGAMEAWTFRRTFASSN